MIEKHLCWITRMRFDKIYARLQAKKCENAERNDCNIEISRSKPNADSLYTLDVNRHIYGIVSNGGYLLGIEDWIVGWKFTSRRIVGWKLALLELIKVFVCRVRSAERAISNNDPP